LICSPKRGDDACAMTVANASPFAALGCAYVAPDGLDVVLVAVKATFVQRADGRWVVADEQVEVRAGDVANFPDATDSSVRYPADSTYLKRGTDVVIVGEAISPKPVTHLDVAARVRDRTVVLRVHGERLYYRGAMGVAVGPAAPFERKPIVYERAYGGTDPSGSALDPRNPVGRAFAKNAASLVDTPAPQIEDPAHPITSASDRPTPVGFGATGPGWQPRVGYAGTFDETWRRTRIPLMPLDFDLRFNNVAHPSLQFDRHLVPGDPIAIMGMTEGAPLQLEIPRLSIVLYGRYEDGRVVEARPPIDTALIEPLDRRLELTLRHAFPMGRGKRLLREVRVDQDD
jgi:hypothetical protein